MYFFRFIFILCSIGINYSYSQANFVVVKNREFRITNKEYKFFGTNYWYGGFLAADSPNNGKQRVCEELDFLNHHGVKNLRVIISSEGDSSYPYRIYPSIQEKPMIYNESVLKGFDYFVYEASKRNMKIVFVLNNNWEWSGGFGQYLEWAGEKNPILPKTANWDWDKYCQYISKFYTCNECHYWYEHWIQKIILRKNFYSGILYKNDPTIMSWELCNEPRPMKTEAIKAYKAWIKKTSDLIKSIDKNHLVTIGVEGTISTMQDTYLLNSIHRFSSIDYTTIHIWPKTWQWYNGESKHSTTDTTLEKTKKYIELNAKLAQALNKPFVIEEFGLHRDENQFVDHSKTEHRDNFYRFVYEIGKAHKASGFNFWGSFAWRDSKINGDYWKNGNAYGADPPQEEQGLYGVYRTDSSTWMLIKTITNSFSK